MNKVRVVVLAGVLVMAGCSSGSVDTTTTTTHAPVTATTTSAAPAFTPTGSDELDACITAALDAITDIDLSADNLDVQLEAALGEGAIPACDSLTEEQLAASGLTMEEAATAVMDALPSEVAEWLSNPVNTPFEHVVDEL